MSIKHVIISCVLALQAVAHPAMAAQWLTDNSVYQVDATLTSQEGKMVQWSELQGKPRVVTMLYTNCHMMCPLIVQQAMQLDKQIPAHLKNDVGMVMISLDPKRDTPNALQEAAHAYKAPNNWMWLQPKEDDVRTLASVLDVSYRFRDDGSINHTSVLVLLDAHGQEVGRSEVSGIAPDPKFVSLVTKTIQEFQSVSPQQ